MNRLEAFSDAIFAIAITLLGLELKAPRLHPGGMPLSESLLDLWPSYLALVTSFVTVFIMWMIHHIIFKYVRGANAAFTIANGFLLLLVTLVPFPTALVTELLSKGDEQTACVVYAGLFALISVPYDLVWRVAAGGRRLLRPDLSDEVIRRFGIRLRAALPAFLLAMGAAYLSPALSIGICAATWALWGSIAYRHFAAAPAH